MVNRYETVILDHIVTLSRDRVGRFEVSIEGPAITTKHDRSFSTFHEAKIEAHSFAHSTLRASCACKGLQWRIVPDEMPSRGLDSSQLTCWSLRGPILWPGSE